MLAAMLLVMLMALRERRDVIVEDVKFADRRPHHRHAAGRLCRSRRFPESAYELLFAVLVMLGSRAERVGLAHSRRRDEM